MNDEVFLSVESCAALAQLIPVLAVVLFVSEGGVLDRLSFLFRTPNGGYIPVGGRSVYVPPREDFDEYKEARIARNTATLYWAALFAIAELLAIFGMVTGVAETNVYVAAVIVAIVVLLVLSMTAQFVFARWEREE